MVTQCDDGGGGGGFLVIIVGGALAAYGLQQVSEDLNSDITYETSTPNSHILADPLLVAQPQVYDLPLASPTELGITQQGIADTTTVQSLVPQQLVDPLPQPKKAADLIVNSATSIANGHAYDKHVVAQGEFPEIKSRADFEQLIAEVMNNPDENKALSGGRHAYWKGDVIVITNPRHPDGGTAFRPTAGKAYYDRQ
jgi:hypothetical protein